MRLTGTFNDPRASHVTLHLQSVQANRRKCRLGVDNGHLFALFQDVGSRSVGYIVLSKPSCDFTGCPSICRRKIFFELDPPITLGDKSGGEQQYGLITLTTS